MTKLSCPILLNNTAVCYACARECVCVFFVLQNVTPAFKARYASLGEVTAVTSGAYV